jgi:hypothetical protein
MPRSRSFTALGRRHCRAVADRIGCLAAASIQGVRDAAVRFRAGAAPTVTLDMVAQAAGASPSTVSRLLSSTAGLPSVPSARCPTSGHGARPTAAMPPPERVPRESLRRQQL